MLFLFPMISAINISIDYPGEVYVNENFTLEINTDSIQLYDVKVDIISKDKRISKIYYDGKWKSTMYYTKMSLKENASYQLKLEEKAKEAEIIVKLRNYKGDIKEFSGYKISSISKKQKNKVQDINETIIQEEEKEEEDENENRKKEEENKDEKSKKEIQRKEISFEEELKPIILNPKSIKKKENTQIQGKGFAKYSIILFCVILCFLYVFKTKEKKDEFR